MNPIAFDPVRPLALNIFDTSSKDKERNGQLTHPREIGDRRHMRAIGRHGADPLLCDGKLALHLMPQVLVSRCQILLGNGQLQS